MRLENWQGRLGWLAMVTAILAASPLAQAQQRDVEVDKDRDVLVITTDDDAPPKSRPWLGLHCVPVEPSLRAHVKLPEGQGLVVASLAPEGPAMKAGIQPNDILLKAGDRPLKEVPDLVKALEAGGDKPLAIEFLRSGETKTIEVTPGQRDIKAIAVDSEGPDRDIVRRWVERVQKVAPLTEGLADRIRIFRPGIPVEAPFPKDLNLSITKEGDAPAKIAVKKGDEQWEVTEDKLTDLPESVRGHVETFLGKLPSAPVIYALPPPGEPGAKPGEPAAAPKDATRARDLERYTREREEYAQRVAEKARRMAAEAERRVREQAEPKVERFGKRIEELERQLMERLEKLDRLIEERTEGIEAAPAKPAAPAEPAKPAEPAQPDSGPTLPTPEET